MRRWVAQPVVVQDLQQLGLFQGADRLARLVMVDQDQAHARRVERIPLPADAHVQPVLIHHPEIIAFLAQDAVKRIADAAARLEARHVGVASLPAGQVQDFGDAHLLAARVRAHQPG